MLTIFVCFPEWYTNTDITNYLIRKSVLVHLNPANRSSKQDLRQSNEDKFQMLVFMVKKLFCLVQDKCAVEGVDSVMMQEVVLGGHLYLQVWSLTQFYSVDCSQSRIGVKKCVFNKRTIKACVSCC